MKKSLKTFTLLALSLILIASIFGCKSKNQPSKENIPLSMDSGIVSGPLKNGMDYFVQRNTNEKVVLLWPVNWLFWSALSASVATTRR